MFAALIDQNLSNRLPRFFRRRGWSAVHVQDLDLDRQPDDRVRAAAVFRNAIVFTKDTDFVDSANRAGAPPKVVHLPVGNARTTEVLALLDSRWIEIEAFAADPNGSLLTLD